VQGFARHGGADSTLIVRVDLEADSTF